MKIKIVDNFIGSVEQKKKISKDSGGVETHSRYSYKILSGKLPKQDVLITFKDYQQKSENNLTFSFSKKNKKAEDDELIFSLKKELFVNEANLAAKTGNYVGKFMWDGHEIDIRSRFPDSFLQRMLNIVDDIFLDDVEIFNAEKSRQFDTSKHIIYYMFVQKLERAFLLGVPKAYRSVLHHEMKLKGRIDIDRCIRQDIPFQGKISSVSREQKEIQEIIDTLHKAVLIVDKYGRDVELQLTKNITNVKGFLKQNKSNQYVSNLVLQKALSSRALLNPIYTPYKQILELAKLIINRNNLQANEKGKQKTLSFLVNVAELFELYITKLLQKEFPDWQVGSESARLYPEQFYSRKIIPDIVMRKNNKVVVFDTKYKRMKLRGTKENHWDVDRNDFFQINSYMSYYQNISSNNKLIVGGLLYPIESKFDKGLCYSQAWFGNENVIFIVDGIDLSGLKSCTETSLVKCIIKSEEEFIDRIRILLELY